MTRRIDNDVLNQILSDHKKWLMSGRHITAGTRADLRGINFQGLELNLIELQYADLRGADLRNTSLYDTDFRGADLRGAQLDIGFRACYDFWGAQFTADALPWLILHPQWAREDLNGIFVEAVD